MTVRARDCLAGKLSSNRYIRPFESTKHRSYRPSRFQVRLPRSSRVVRCGAATGRGAFEMGTKLSLASLRRPASSSSTWCDDASSSAKPANCARATASFQKSAGRFRSSGGELRSISSSDICPRRARFARPRVGPFVPGGPPPPGAAPMDFKCTGGCGQYGRNRRAPLVPDPRVCPGREPPRDNPAPFAITRYSILAPCSPSQQS